MKIALIDPEYTTPGGFGHGGIATYTRTLAGQLVRRGHTVHVLKRTHCPEPNYPAGVKIHCYGFLKSKNPFSRMIDRFAGTPSSWEIGFSRSINVILSEIERSEGLDIIEFPEYGGLANCVTQHDAACVVTLHMPSQMVDSLNCTTPTHDRKKIYAMERKTIFHADAIKSPSEAIKSWVCKNYGINPSIVTILRNPFDIKMMSTIRRPTTQQPHFDILFCGRLERRKGAEILLKTVNKILAISPEIIITIAGETQTGNSINYHQAIERSLSQKERRRVWFPGPLSQHMLVPLYANSSLFLLPSLFENSPYVLLEAMAAGLPVVATTGSGIEEIVNHGKNGLLFSPENISEMISHITALFMNRERAMDMGKNNIAFIRETYDPDKIIEAHCAFYRSAIAGKN